MHRINLISGPRNVSTALMYSFAQRKDTAVVDEPFYACYLNSSNVDHPGKQEVLNSQPVDPGKVIEKLLTSDEDREVLFIKNMAHHLDKIDPRFLVPLTNIFLIREPEAMLTSFIKTIPKVSLYDTAYKQQVALFEYLKKTMGRVPLVLDSKQLLLNPEKVLQEVCQKTGIPFDKSMLSWKPGPLKEDGVWAKHWYHNVHKSTGFKPYRPKKEKLPEKYGALLEKCQNYCNQLATHAIQA